MKFEQKNNYYKVVLIVVSVSQTLVVWTNKVWWLWTKYQWSEFDISLLIIDRSSLVTKYQRREFVDSSSLVWWLELNTQYHLIHDNECHYHDTDNVMII